MQLLCVKCKGRSWCGKPCPILNKFKQFQPSIKEEFSGSSPPEVFVGRYGYPKVFTGILAPPEYGSMEKLSMPEFWFREKANIIKILSYRSNLIYSRFTSQIKNPKGKLLELMQEIAIANKSVATEFKLKKKPIIKMQLSIDNPIIGNPAPLKQAKLEENPRVEKKVDYLISDTDLKAGKAIEELYSYSIPISNIIKILSVGMLGLKTQRKLVPTRWSCTAVDSIISQNLFKKIKLYPWVNEFLVFSDEYIGNHYEILLIPRQLSFEVLEAKIPGSVWNPNLTSQTYITQDYENFFGRKDYADSVTGAYYANRLAAAEYLCEIKRQASVLVLRECKPEYWAPLGVGILREVTRSAFRKKPKKFTTLNESLSDIQTRLQLPIKEFIEKSRLLKEYRKQSTLRQFMSI